MGTSATLDGEPVISDFRVDDLSQAQSVIQNLQFNGS
jgi:hypothetical protein